MKPRNKLQHRVLNLSLNMVMGITKSQKEWAYQECLPHIGYANKTSAFCLDCGETFSLELIKRKRVTCPSCQAKLKIIETRKTTSRLVNYFAIAEIIDEFQVIRNFELIASYKKGQPVNYELKAILEHWVLPSGKYEMVGLNHNLQGCCDSWGGDWSIRKEGRSYYYRKFEVNPSVYYPKSVFKPEYSKYGINHNLKILPFLEAISIAPRNPQVETLLKAKQYSLAGYGNSYIVQKYWPSIKICFRNKYKVKDASLWIDYLDLLKYFNKDLRNSKYICPKNLEKEHNNLVEKKRVIQEREKLERKKKRTEEAQKEYLKQKKMFLGLMFSNNDITVKVLESVQEFVEEGDKLKHCVFTNEYYNKEDSLILSARINGEPVETIEVSLSKKKVVQSRGKRNEPTEHHDQILNLVNNNLHKIIDISKGLKQTA